jgi:hypothetical protein
MIVLEAGEQTINMANASEHFSRPFDGLIFILILATRRWFK